MSDALIAYILVILIVFLIFVLLCRWIFRINKIVNTLEKYLECFASGF